MTSGIAVLALLIVVYAAIAKKLDSWSITMPMVFVIIGVILGATNILPLTPNTESIKGLTELTLALLLFADASTLKLAEVRDDASLPARLLGIGLVLTIIAGAVAALILMPKEGLAVACLLGAILAPTDAALGLPIFNNARVPVRIRRALNIESGLNDGIATPFVLLFLGFAVDEVTHSGGGVVGAVVEIALAILAGVLVGGLGGWLLTKTAKRGWTVGGAEQLAVLGLAMASYFGSLAIGGNGFIAAFVGGIALRATSRDSLVEPTEFTETLGSFLSLLVWAIFGTVLVVSVVRYISDWRPIVYAVISLTVVRMVPVAIAMLGAGLRRDTVTLMGWFGPRGLASVVFTLLAVETFQEAGHRVDMVIAAATWTILLSVVLHGLSATPLSRWYARRLEAAKAPLAEFQDMPEMRGRRQVLEGPK